MTKQSKKSEKTAATLRCLLVDDDIHARGVVAEYLKSFGITDVREVSDGAQALVCLSTETFDLIISDWDMPSMTGLDLLQAVKTEPRLRDIPFIMVTSPISHEENKVKSAAIFSVDAYLIKPFRSGLLKTKIENVLSRSKNQVKRTVLLVDDDAQVRETVREYLETMGYTQILEAKDGAEGHELLKKNIDDIAIVISDWEMPRLAGIDLLKRIRDDEATKDVPFIMCTSQTSIERLKLSQAIEGDVDQYLLKPFRYDDLSKKITECLERFRRAQKLREDLDKGKEFLERGSYGEAFTTFQKLSQSEPKNTEALLGLAVAQKYIAPEKAIPKATQILRHALSIDPACERAYVDLAVIFESAMSLDRAIGTLRDGLVYCPFSPTLHFELGRILLRRGLRDEGLVEIQKCLDLDPTHEQASVLVKQ